MIRYPFLKSAPAKIRAREFNEMMTGEVIDIIIPPWGGELLIEILPFKRNGGMIHHHLVSII